MKKLVIEVCKKEWWKVTEKMQVFCFRDVTQRLQNNNSMEFSHPFFIMDYQQQLNQKINYLK